MKLQSTPTHAKISDWDTHFSPLRQNTTKSEHSTQPFGQHLSTWAPRHGLVSFNAPDKTQPADYPNSTYDKSDF
jgi:hypothetical protein